MSSDEASPPPPLRTTPGAPVAALRSHVRGSALLLAGRPWALAANFVTQVLSVRLLSQADYGAFAYALTFVAPATTLIALGLGRGVARYVPLYQERQEHDKVRGAVLFTVGTVLALGLTVVASVILFRSLLIDRSGEHPLAYSLLAILIILAPIQALDTLFLNLFAIFASARAIFLRKHVLGPLLKLGAVAVVWAAGADAYLLAAGYVIGGLAGTVVSAVFLVQILRSMQLLGRSRVKSLIAPWKDIMAFSLPLMLGDVASTLRDAAVVWNLQFFRSLGAVALFRAVLPVAKLNGVVSDSFRPLFTPQAARFYARGDREAIDRLYWRTVSWIAVLSFPIVATTVALATPLVVLMFGESYAGAGTVLAILSIGLFLDSLVRFNVLVLRVHGYVKVLLLGDVVGTVLLVGLAFALVRSVGAAGGAVAVVAADLVQTGVYQITLRRCGLQAFPLAQVRLLGTIGSALLAVFLAHSLIGSLWLSVVLIPAAACLVAYLHRDLLDVGGTFPEAVRLPLVRHLVGSASA